MAGRSSKGPGCSLNTHRKPKWSIAEEEHPDQRQSDKSHSSKNDNYAYFCQLIFTQTSHIQGQVNHESNKTTWKLFIED